MHHYQASTQANDAALWIDEVAARNWPLNGLVRNHPLVTPSGFAGITASYQTTGTSSASGITTGSFQYTDFTVELWARPDPAVLGESHQVLFESGGGQNGTAILLTQTGLRFIGSDSNVRNLDVVIPTEGLNLADFIQIVYAVRGSQVNLYVRDAAGLIVTRSVTAKVSHGSNSAALFNVSGGVNTLGGRTELADVTPTGLTGFTGEIALLNIYDRALTPEAVEKSYQNAFTPPLLRLPRPGWR